MSDVTDGRLPRDLRADCRRRTDRFASKLCEHDIDAAIVVEPENIRYLTGFETVGLFTPMLCLVYSDRSCRILCRTFELANVRKKAPDAEAATFGDDQEPIAALEKILPRTGLIGCDFGYAGWALRELRKVRGFEKLVDVGPILYGLRSIKSGTELRYLRLAAETTRVAMVTALEATRDARYESEIVSAAYEGLIRAGATYPSSPVYVTSGSRTAEAHVTWAPGRRVDRHVVLIEIGGCVERYTSPLMVSAMEETPRAMALGQGAIEVLNAAIAAVRPGVAVGAVDTCAQACARDLGMLEHVRHRIGYSVGVSFPPGWGEPHVLAVKSTETEELRAGMVFHLVSQLMDEGWGGVGVSATIAVREDGVEVLTEHNPRIVVL